MSIRLALLAFVTAIAMLPVPSASAATTSVEGTGSYEKLVLANQQDAVVLKMTTPGGECDIRYLKATFRDRDGTKYSVDGGCYPGAIWAASLTKGDDLVDCGGLRLVWKADAGLWKATVPRTCLRGLAGAVKVTKSWVDDTTPNINEAGPTSYVARG